MLCILSAMFSSHLEDNIIVSVLWCEVAKCVWEVLVCMPVGMVTQHVSGPEVMVTVTYSWVSGVCLPCFVSASLSCPSVSPVWLVWTHPDTLPEWTKCSVFPSHPLPSSFLKWGTLCLSVCLTLSRGHTLSHVCLTMPTVLIVSSLIRHNSVACLC